MKTIVVSNRKGGTGKTTIAYNLGFQYAIDGKSVLFIDLDSQGNLSFLCGKDRQSLEDFKAVRVQQVNAKIDLLAATANFATLEDEIQRELDRNVYLKTAIFPQLAAYDYVIIDTPPSLSILNVNAWMVADLVHVVVEADAFSMIGLREMTGILDQVKGLNTALSYHIVLNTFNKGRTMSEEALEELEQHTEFQGIAIPNREYIVQCNAERKPAIDHEVLSPIFDRLAAVV